MASPHFSATEVKRGNGHSSVASAAYNARADLTDLRTGESHDYTRHRSACLFEGLYAPKDAPEWARDRSQLWNHVEAFEKHRRAILAVDIDIALPHELTLEQNRRLLQDWVRENATRKGLVADVAIHEPDRRGDARNIHAHVMIVTRKLDGSEFVRAKDRFETYTEKDAARKADLLAMRASWEKLANRHLERYGHEARIDMGRKQDGEPTRHMGKHAMAMERRGEATELGDLNRGIIAANENSREAAALMELAAGQADRFAQQDRDRAGIEAEQRPLHRDAAPEFVTTLDAIRRREAEDEKAKRGSMDGAARRALDELARVDPIGTARHFGHHAGDRLKSPEDMRREQAERQHQVKQQTPAPPSPMPAGRPQEAVGRPQGQAGLSMLRAALASMQARLAAISGRLEQARQAIRLEQGRTVLPVARSNARAPIQPGPSHAQQSRDEASSRQANRRIAEGMREDERERQAQQREAERTAALDYRNSTTPTRGPGKPQRRASLFADELAKAEAKAAVQRLREALERPGEHDHHERGRKL